MGVVEVCTCVAALYSCVACVFAVGVRYFAQDVGELIHMSVKDCITNRDIILKKAKQNYGGSPCDDFSPVNAKQKENADCVKKCTGVSGEGYRKEREYIKEQDVPVSLEEQVC